LGDNPVLSYTKTCVLFGLVSVSLKRIVTSRKSVGFEIDCSKSNRMDAI